MKQLLFPLFLALSINVCAQDTTFSRIYEPLVGELSGYEPVSDAAIVWDDGLITSGFITDVGTPAFLARIAPNGNLMWQKRFSSNSIFDPRILFNQLISTRDSSFVAVGKYVDESASESRPFCMKLNASGDTLWTRSFFLTNQTIGSFQDVVDQCNGKVVETVDSSLLVGFQFASFEQSPAHPDHLCLSKLNMQGDVIWSKSFITDSAFLLQEIVQATDSSYYLIGESSESGNYSHLLNISPDGQLNWARKYQGLRFQDIELDSNYLYVSWMIDFYESGLMKLDLSGNHVKRIRNYISSQGARGIKSTRRSNGNIVSAPMEFNFGFPGGFIEVDENLDGVAFFYPNMLMNEVVSIPNSGVYAIGFGPLYGIKIGYVEMGVVRLDSLMSAADCVSKEPPGLSDLDSIASFSVNFLESDTLSFVSTNLIYENVAFISTPDCVTFLGSVAENEGTWNETISPNPSTGQFTISWNDYRDVELVIFNSIGTEVYRTTAKNSFIEIDLENQQNGLYYYRLQDENGGESSGKLSLMK